MLASPDSSGSKVSSYPGFEPLTFCKVRMIPKPYKLFASIINAVSCEFIKFYTQEINRHA